ncbi:MAG: hypothetical protein N2Z76_04335 [Treponemataceae bacterium]|nr:hypothetical protein [Treponemataceae bacterium]
MDSENLQKYIAQIHRIKGKAQGKKEDFEAVARELGITDQDLTEIYQYAASCKTRAQELLRSGFYREALDCAREAYEITPWSAETCALIGTIYKVQGETSFFPFPSYRKALWWYKKATELQARYYTVYEQMRYIQRQFQQYLRMGWVVGITLFLLLGSVFLFRSFTSVSSTPAGGMNMPVGKPTSTTPHNIPMIIPNPEQTIPTHALFSEEEGLKFHLQSSTLYRYAVTEPAFSVNIKGTLQAHQREIYEIILTQQWYDTSGKLLFKGTKKVLSPPNAPLEPGDVLPINLLVYERQTAPPVAQVVLEIEKIDSIPRRHASEGRAVPLRWIASPPEGLALDITLRSHKIHSFKDTHYVGSIILIINRGEKRLHFLRISPVYRRGTTELRGNELIVLSPDNAYLLPGDRYPFYIIDTFTDSSPEHLELSSIEIREIE